MNATEAAVEALRQCDDPAAVLRAAKIALPWDMLHREQWAPGGSARMRVSRMSFDSRRGSPIAQVNEESEGAAWWVDGMERPLKAASFADGMARATAALRLDGWRTLGPDVAEIPDGWDDEEFHDDSSDEEPFDGDGDTCLECGATMRSFHECYPEYPGDNDYLPVTGHDLDERIAVVEAEAEGCDDNTATTGRGK